MTTKRMTARQFIAREIRAGRENRVMTRADLAKAAIVSESLVRAWEAGRRVPQSEDLENVEKILGTNGYLSRIREDLVKNAPVPEYMDRWLELEQNATSTVTYEPLLVSGLFQTPEYAYAVFEESGRKVDDINLSVQERIKRQEILAPEHDLMVIAIMDEGILERPIGGKEVMHGQMLRLLKLAAQHNIGLQIVPMDAGAYSGLSGGFVIATVDGKEYAYVDDTFSGDVIEDPEEVATIQRIWATLSVKALTAKQSIERIEKAAEKWKP